MRRSIRTDRSPPGMARPSCLDCRTSASGRCSAKRCCCSPSLRRDERFSTNSKRSAARDELRAIIVEAFATLTAEQVVERLDDAQIANARVNDMHDVWKHPQLQARKRWREVDHAGRAGPRTAAARLVGGGRAAYGRRTRAWPAHRFHSGRNGLLASGLQPRAAKAIETAITQDVRTSLPLTYLFVPGNRPERFDKALASGRTPWSSTSRMQSLRRKGCSPRADLQLASPAHKSRAQLSCGSTTDHRMVRRRS